MSRVFISHAEADSESAVRVTRALESAGMQVVFDREHLSFGESFLTFVETALDTSDFCLLLWSRSAARSSWVTVEWQSALVHTVNKRRGFLVVARLESHDVPTLLKPRLFVDLFPDLEAGVRTVVERWLLDRKVEQLSEKAVVGRDVPNAEHGASFYVTSQLFAFTVPIMLPLAVPIAACVERFVSHLALPKRLEHDGRIGLLFEYSFAFDGRTLRQSATLVEERIPENALLNLLVETKPFAVQAPAAGSLAGAVFRDRGRRVAARPPGSDDLAAIARSALQAAIVKAGLA